MSWLKEALEYLVGNGKASNTVQTIKEYPQARKLLIKDGDGSLQLFDEPGGGRKATLSGFDDFVTYVQSCPSPEVYLGHDGAVLLENAGMDERRATWRFWPTQRYSSIALVDHAYSQKALLTFLRTHDIGPGGEILEKAIAKMDFKRNSVGARTVEHGRESLGKSVEAVVQGVDEIPRSVTLSARIWSNPGLTFVGQIIVAVLLDLENEKIHLRAAADAHAVVMSNTLQALKGDLQKALGKVPIYLGDV